MNEEFDYRIMYHENKHVNSYYQVHRVYYKADGSIDRIVDMAASAYGNNIKDLMLDLGKMINSDKRPIIDYKTKKEIL